ncbi:hypothetical protein ACOCJ5_05425 [Knoellia sp. CPCC 206450]|uniref:hypothetical protein n=1 Tax=Knoellia tibetensis TaxID=3404798 RepID=UPI003B42ADD0
MTVGVGETRRAAEPEGALARPLLRRVLAAVVVASWLAWAVPSWMSSLQEVRPHEFVADVQADRVTGYQVATNVLSEPMRFSAPDRSWDADLPAADNEGRPLDWPPRQIVYSVDGATRTRWVPQAVFTVGDRDAFTALTESGARPFTSATYPPNRDWAAYPALLALAVGLFSLVVLPPTRGTRPFWFLTGTASMGLGVVAYAVAELWWRRPSPTVDGARRDDDGTYVGDGAGRLRGWHGVIAAIVGGLVAAVLRGAIT